MPMDGTLKHMQWYKHRKMHIYTYITYTHKHTHTISSSHLALRVHQHRVSAGTGDHDAVLNGQLIGGQALQGPLPHL